MKNALKILCPLGLLLGLAPGQAALRGQTPSPALFVNLSTSQVASGAAPTAATTTTITPPGAGWAYSAAAPVAGTMWNNILRPNPSIGSNSTSTVGQYICNSADGIALTSSTGEATGVTLSVWIDIQDLEGNTTRTEPNSSAAGSTVLGPAGLMGQAWRIYRGGNGSIHRFAGLTPGRHYFLYVYGTTTTTGQGAKFILDADNTPFGGATFVEVRGGNSGNIFTTDGSTYALTAPAPVNVASTSADNNSWGRLHAVADAGGTVEFRTAKNAANGQYLNGYQLVPYPTPVITLQPPVSATATVGGDVTLTVAATGEGTITYQWRKDGSPLANGASGLGSTYSGVDGVALTISGVSAADEGDYDVLVVNEGGATPSVATVLGVTTEAIAPSIVAAPVSTTAVTGAPVGFSVSANGTAPLSYRWQKSVDNVTFTDVEGATASALDLASVTVNDAGYYRVVVTNSVDSATSAAATLTVAPVINVPPATTLVTAGSTHTISVVADAGAGSPAPVTYVWKRDGATVGDGGAFSGAATADLLVTGFTAAQSGYYTVTVSNTAGSATSAPVYVGVTSTQSVTFAPGNNATGIAIDQQLRLVFPSMPKIGKAGGLTVRDAADDSIVSTIDVSQFQTFSLFSATITNAASRSVQGAGYYYMPVAIHGNEVWITLGQRLAYGKTYYVNIDAGALLDSTNAAFPGVSGAVAWRFSTKAAGPATPTASTGPTEITVGHDGDGDFATLQGASDWIPQNNTLPRTIRIRPGVYRDNATFAQNRHLVTLLGEGATREGVQLYYPYPAFNTANDRGAGTLRIESDDVTVRNLTVDNGVYIAQPASGAPAFAGPIQTVQTTGSRLVFDNVLIKGGQDTLYTIRGVAYFHNCEIWGSVDFIYGEALGVFDNCDIVQIRPVGGPVGAPNTPLAQPYGEVFLNCRFPRALVADGYPYDVGVGTTTFMRPWRQDGATAVINCQIGAQFSTKAWSEWSAAEGEKSVTCRAREYGTTMIGGAAAPTVAQRQAAGAFWLNTIDPDYTGLPMEPSNPLVAHPAGSGNRVAVNVDPADYTLEAIFGHPYFALNGWMPTVEGDVAPEIVTDPAAQTVAVGQSVTFTVEATGTPVLAYQWFKTGGASVLSTASSYTIASAALSDAGSYYCVVTNASGSDTSASAALSVLSAVGLWAQGFGLDGSAPGFASADADGDGVANLLEYVLGGDPTAPDSGLLPRVTLVEAVDGKHLVLEYVRAAAAASVPVGVETSSDLVVWSARTDGVDAEVEVIPFLGQAINLDVNTNVANNHAGLAVAPGDGTVWNSFLASTPTINGLLDASGAATPVNLTITSSGGFSAWSNTTNGAPNPLPLMQDYLFGNTYTVTMGGLPEGGYQLHVYAHGDQDNQTSTITVAAGNGGGVKATALSAGGAFRDAFAAGAEGVAYVKFTPTVGPAGTLQFTAANYLNGFQLVQVLDPDRERVRVTIPFAGERLFARLRATIE